MHQSAIVLVRCVPGSSLLSPPYWKARRPWGRGRFESLAGNDFSERGAQAEAHCERNLNSANCEVLDEKHRMIAVKGIFVGIIIKLVALLLR